MPGTPLDNYKRERYSPFDSYRRNAPASLPGVTVPSRPPIDALRGSLDLLVLKTLALAPEHGWGISQRIQQISGGEFTMNQGSLYPALQRMEKDGLIASEWGVTDNNRQARYYRITAAGRRALGSELENWKRFAAALDAVLRAT